MDVLRSFASDNNSGVHPRVLEAMLRANDGSAPAYGTDSWTARATSSLQEAFGPKARPWLVFLGTAANVLGLKTIVRPHQCILCAETAHIYSDECGAPEAVTGSKLIPLPSHAGKINLADCEGRLSLRNAVHQTYPAVLSITQATEYGTVYTLDELKTISAFCREHKLYLHMDGARLANAAVHLGVGLREITADAGIDVVSFGGTKNGLMFGEALVFLNDELGHEFGYVRKQHMQLGSKMRFMGAQFMEYLHNDLWRENALAANRMAALLADEIRGLDHIRIAHPVQINAVFARLHKKAIAKLNERFYFYIFDASDAEGYPSDWPMVRLMTAFNTTEEQVREFAGAIKACGDIR